MTFIIQSPSTWVHWLSIIRQTSQLCWRVKHGSRDQAFFQFFLSFSLVFLIFQLFSSSLHSSSRLFYIVFSFVPLHHFLERLFLSVSSLFLFAFLRPKRSSLTALLSSPTLHSSFTFIVRLKVCVSSSFRFHLCSSIFFFIDLFAAILLLP